MAATPVLAAPRPSPVRAWVARHPVAAYFLGAYAITWLVWLPRVAGWRGGASSLVLLAGVFGPLISATVVTRATGGSVRAWLRRIVRFRVAARWYAFALLVPIGASALVTAELLLVGVSLDAGLLGERLGSYLPVLAFCLLLNGGPEEFGWRGFALPRLQERLTPVRATALLGVVWALWHVPLFLAEDGNTHGLGGAALAGILVYTVIGIIGYSFFYTYAWNATGSVVIAMLLHASFNAANGVLLLVPESAERGWTYAAMALCQTTTILAITGLLISRTRGRLNRR